MIAEREGEIRKAKREIRKRGLALVRGGACVGYTLGNAEINEFEGGAAVVVRPGCGK
jgi:hypothetical protein